MRSSPDSTKVQASPGTSLLRRIRYAVAPLVLISACGLPAKPVSTVAAVRPSPAAAPAPAPEPPIITEAKPANRECEYDVGRVTTTSRRYAEASMLTFELNAPNNMPCMEDGAVLEPGPDISIAEQSFNMANTLCVMHCDDGDADCADECTVGAYRDSSIRCDAGLLGDEADTKEFCDKEVMPNHTIPAEHAKSYVMFMMQICRSNFKACTDGVVREKLQARCEINPAGLQSYCDK